MMKMNLNDKITLFKMIGIDAEELDKSLEQLINIMSKAVSQGQISFIEAALLKDIFENGLNAYKSLLS